MVFTCSKRRAAPSLKQPLGQSGFSSLQVLASDKACSACPNRNQQRLRFENKVWSVGSKSIAYVQAKCQKITYRHKLRILLDFRISFSVEYLCVSVNSHLEILSVKCVLSSCFCFCSFRLCFWGDLWKLRMVILKYLKQFDVREMYMDQSMKYLRKIFLDPSLSGFHLVWVFLLFLKMFELFQKRNIEVLETKSKNQERSNIHTLFDSMWARIPSTVQSETDSGFVVSGNRISTTFLLSLAAATSNGLLPSWKLLSLRQNQESYARIVFISDQMNKRIG